MLSTYHYPKYEYVTPPEQKGGEAKRYPVVVVGAGPVGLAAAIELAQSGVPVVVLDDDDTVSVGSRGVCYAKRALEVLDRIGVGDDCVAKGVSWNVGRTFFREEEVYNFNLLPQPDHKRPGMINLQQYYLEEYLVKRATQLPNLDLRFRNKVVSVVAQGDGATLQVETPDGIYTLETDWLVAADGARSGIRRMMDLEIEGKIFMDRFLIADVVMKADFPAERWFWFDPPFHPGQSVLLHRQADNVYRIDFQLGWQADPEEEKKPANVHPAHQGHARRRPRVRPGMGQRLHLPVPAHAAVPPRPRALRRRRRAPGLALRRARRQLGHPGHRQPVLEAQAGASTARRPDSLLDTYSDERVFAADENIMNSTRSTDFITPEIEDLADLPQCRAEPGPRPCLRPRAGQFGAPVGAVLPHRVVAEHAGYGRASPATWCPARRWTMRR